VTTFRAPTIDDADWIARLIIDCDIFEYGEPDYDRDELLSEWGEPGVELDKDAFVTEGAYGLVLNTDARAWVHPDHRGMGLGSALAAMLEARARERGLPHLDQHLASKDAAGRHMLESRGYVYRHSYAWMTLPAAGVDDLPRGGCRPYDPDRDEQAVQDLLLRAFSDDGGRVDPLEVVLARKHDLGLWFVSDAADGTLAGALRGELREGRGYIAAVGTETAHRGRGVASTLIGEAARALGDAERPVHQRRRPPALSAAGVHRRLGHRRVPARAWGCRRARCLARRRGEVKGP
jgi:ribosomal protein S18 acetylase RimI-like enzyme